MGMADGRRRWAAGGDPEGLRSVTVGTMETGEMAFSTRSPHCGQDAEP